MRKRWLALILLLFLLAGRLYWQYTEPGEPEQYSMICIPKTYDPTNDFWSVLVQGAEMAAEEYGVSLEIMSTEREDDWEGQNALIDEAIEKKPDAILLAAADYEATEPAARRIRESGIRLVIIDSGVRGEPEDTQVSTDNVQAGIRLGAMVKALLKEEGKIGVVSFVPGALSAIDREKGLRVGISDAESRIAEVFYCDSDYDRAYEGTRAMLKQHPDITVLAALNQYAAVGAAMAVSDLGLTGKVSLVGIDSSMKQIQYLEQGALDAIVIQKPFSIGYLGVEKAVMLLEGEPVEAEYDSGSMLITKDNMYIGMNQRLLFPFMEGLTTSVSQ